MPEHPLFFRNWNDLHIVVTVAKHRGFASAALELGVDQTTVARRISDLEFRLGQPLFYRRTTGVTPTAICREVLESILPVTEAMQRIEEHLRRAKDFRPTVTISAPSGVLSYTLEPALKFASGLSHPLDIRPLHRESLSPLKFTDDPAAADISLLVAAENALPAVRGAYSVRRLGSMSFRPFASGKLVLDANFRCGLFDDLKKVPLFSIKPYKHFDSLDAWNELYEGHGRSKEFDTTRELHSAFLTQPAVMLLPTYSHFYEKKIAPLNFSSPDMALSLWLSAHQDALREPEVRTVYDAIGDAFSNSPWFH